MPEPTITGMLVHATEAELVHRLFVPHERWGWDAVAPEPARPSPEESSPPVWTPPAPPDLTSLRQRREAAGDLLERYVTSRTGNG
jgi:hypothetical protein